MMYILVSTDLKGNFSIFWGQQLINVSSNEWANAGSSHELGSNVITAVNCNPPQMPTLPLCSLPISPICFNQAEVGDCWISVKMNQCGFGVFLFCLFCQVYGDIITVSSNGVWWLLRERSQLFWVRT